MPTNPPGKRSNIHDVLNDPSLRRSAAPPARHSAPLSVPDTSLSTSAHRIRPDGRPIGELAPHPTHPTSSEALSATAMERFRVYHDSRFIPHYGATRLSSHALGKTTIDLTDSDVEMTDGPSSYPESYAHRAYSDPTVTTHEPSSAPYVNIAIQPSISGPSASSRSAASSAQLLETNNPPKLEQEPHLITMEDLKTAAGYLPIKPKPKRRGKAIPKEDPYENTLPIYKHPLNWHTVRRAYNWANNDNKQFDWLLGRIVKEENILPTGLTPEIEEILGEECVALVKKRIRAFVAAQADGSAERRRQLEGNGYNMREQGEWVSEGQW